MSGFLASCHNKQWFEFLICDFRLMHSCSSELPVSRASERSLFNDLMLHVFFNFAIWMKKVGQRHTILVFDGTLVGCFAQSALRSRASGQISRPATPKSENV